MNDHVTHVERDSYGWYFWCEAEDCYPDDDQARFPASAEVYALAAEHERNPGG